MKYLLPTLLILATSPALGEETTTPKRLVIGESSQFSLQGWTRLNGTAALDVQTPEAEAISTNDTSQDAERRARLLEAEAAYQKQKSKSKSGW